MAEITAALVKELREKTGAGMMDCKKALGECGGELEAAVDWLRTKGLAAAAKKAGRVASEGLVAISTSGLVGAVVEVNSETDFVARNEDFQSFVEQVAGVALTQDGDLDKTKTAAYPAGGTVESQLTDLIATIGENMTFRRSAAVKVGDGVVATYMHNALKPTLGKIGVLVGLESTGDKEKLAAVGRQIAMHVAAANPQSISRDDLDPEILNREREVLKEQARESGKPEAVIAKMIEGRMKKFYAENTLLGQAFVINPDLTVEAAAKEAGATITGYVRMEVGEGIEKKVEDFAAEVAKVVQG